MQQSLSSFYCLLNHSQLVWSWVDIGIIDGMSNACNKSFFFFKEVGYLRTLERKVYGDFMVEIGKNKAPLVGHSSTGCTQV